MSIQDISLEMPGGRFSYRVGAIIIHAGKILMAQNSGSPFYYSVGGRVRFGESAQEAVVREAFEETRIEFEIDRLAFLHENFFVMEDTGEPFHEMVLFYLMKPCSEAARLENHVFTEDYADVALRWLPADGLAGLQVYPEFFKTEIGDMSDGVRHFITRNGETCPAI